MPGGGDAGLKAVEPFEHHLRRAGVDHHGGNLAAVQDRQTTERWTLRVEVAFYAGDYVDVDELHRPTFVPSSCSLTAPTVRSSAAIRSSVSSSVISSPALSCSTRLS